MSEVERYISECSRLGKKVASLTKENDALKAELSDYFGITPEKYRTVLSALYMYQEQAELLRNQNDKLLELLLPKGEKHKNEVS